MADFDVLPAGSSRHLGINAPIISTKGENSHAHTDHDTYLLPPGQADIFFPTDFNLLKKMYKNATGKTGSVMKTYKF
jgi:hypothetical protein